MRVLVLVLLSAMLPVVVELAVVVAGVVGHVAVGVVRMGRPQRRVLRLEQLVYHLLHLPLYPHRLVSQAAKYVE